MTRTTGRRRSAALLSACVQGIHIPLDYLGPGHQGRGDAAVRVWRALFDAHSPRRGVPGQVTRWPMLSVPTDAHSPGRGVRNPVVQVVPLTAGPGVPAQDRGDSADRPAHLLLVHSKVLP